MASSMKTTPMIYPALTALSLVFGSMPSTVQGQAAMAADWPTWRGPARDGLSPDKGLLKEWPEGGPKLLWSFDKAGKGYSSPAITGGRIYLTGSRGGKAEIICIDAAKGKELWSTPIGEDPEKGYNTGWGGGPRGAPTVSDGMVYAMSANGELTCLTADKGTRDFSHDLFGWLMMPLGLALLAGQLWVQGRLVVKPTADELPPPRWATA